MRIHHHDALVSILHHALLQGVQLKKPVLLVEMNAKMLHKRQTVTNKLQKQQTMTSKLQLQSKIKLRGKGKSWSSLCRAQYLKIILALFIHKHTESCCRIFLLATLREIPLGAETREGCR